MTAEQPTHVVRLPISLLVLQQMLRLPDDTVIHSIEVDPWRHEIDLIVETADAPDGAVKMVPVYQHDADIPDPVSLVGIDWYGHDGKKIEVGEG